MINTLIVEDEPHSREYLKELLSKDDELVLLKEQGNGKSALEIVIAKRPQLVLVDIQMPGLNGIELLHGIQNYYNPIVIFTTAYDEYAIKAFELNAVDYLLKPFDEERLFKSIDRAKKQIRLGQKEFLSDKITKLVNDHTQLQMPYITFLEIKEKGLTNKIMLDEVVYIEANDVYVTIHLKSKSLLYRTSLNNLESSLDPGKFTRVHRSYIINRSCLIACTYLNNNTFQIQLDNGTELISSRSYKEVVKDILQS